jgi:hypothetical protein
MVTASSEATSSRIVRASNAGRRRGTALYSHQSHVDVEQPAGAELVSTGPLLCRRATGRYVHRAN